MLEADQKFAEIDVPEGPLLDTDFLRTKIAVLGPDSWVTRPPVFESWSRLNGLATAVVECPARITLLFDNREHPSVELTIGQLKYPLPVNETGGFLFPKPDLDSGGKARLGEQNIGGIGSIFPGTYLIDTSGHRWYRYRKLNYGPGFATPPEVYDPRYLHGVSEIGVSYFLHLAPETIKSAAPIGIIGELVDKW